MSDFNKLIEIVKKLRAPDGCEWDREQTHESLTPYLLEETYEVIEAIDNNDYVALKEELGDLLLHVIFQAELANEKNIFSLEDSIKNVNKKLIDRHPHIFSNDKIKKVDWETAKQKEKNRDSLLDGVPKALPALLRARRIQERASSVGFDWETSKQVFNKVEEEINELKEALENNVGIEDELGDVLFSIVNLTRHLDLNPETSLKKSIDKFSDRFKKLELELKNRNKSIKDFSLVQLDALWESIKLKEK